MNHPKKITIFLTALIVFMFGFNNFTNAEGNKLFIANGNLNYQCPGGTITAPTNLGIDLNSVRILNNSYFVDKNKTYVVTEDGHSQVCTFNVIQNADPATFKIFNDIYQKDKNNAYYNSSYWGWGVPQVIKFNTNATTFTALSGGYAKDSNNVYYVPNKGTMATIIVVTNADPSTFEVFKEDNEYAMDKTNMYFQGKVLSKQNLSITNNTLYNSLKGKIILKSESNGEAYYVNPNKKEMYSLSRPVIAFRVMREQGIGISNANLEKISVGGNCPMYDQGCFNRGTINTTFSKSQKGKILLQVEASGEAWYVNPQDSKRYFLGRPTDAFNIIKTLGLGISNANFDRMIK